MGRCFVNRFIAHSYFIAKKTGYVIFYFNSMIYAFNFYFLGTFLFNIFISCCKEFINSKLNMRMHVVF